MIYQEKPAILTLCTSMKKTIKLTVFLTLVIFMTACLSEDKKELNGSWQWTQTTISFYPSVVYNQFTNPCNQYLKIKLVFAGNYFIFYKDNVVISTGRYKVEDSNYNNYGHTCVIVIPEKNCNEINAATSGTITIKNRTLASYSDISLVLMDMGSTLP